MPDEIFVNRISTYPDDRETAWSEELQGVSHDEENWYITQKNCIWKIPLSVDLNSDINDDDPGIITAPIPSSLANDYNHFGDPGCVNDLLFVPLENTDGETTSRIACFSTAALSFLGSVSLSQQGTHAPWCAVNPGDGLLYSSPFDTDTLFVYSFSLGSEFTLLLHHTISLKNERDETFTLRGIQGGAFSYSDAENILYLSSNSDDERGVHAFNFPEARRIKYVSIPTDFFTVGEEIEGLTYFDLDGRDVPGISGQLHVLELDNDVFESDDVKAFYHYRISRSQYVANVNPSSKEVHRSDCEWIKLMLPENKKFYATVEEALEDGFNGCFYCLRQYNTG